MQKVREGNDLELRQADEMETSGKFDIYFGTKVVISHGDLG